MKNLGILLAVSVLSVSSGLETRPEAAGRLKRALFKNYDKNLIPLQQKGKGIRVAAGLSMINMDLDIESGVLDSRLWGRFVWQDSRLTWEEDDFGGINALRVPISDLWTPDFEIYNALNYKPGYFSHEMANGKKSALLYPDGEVLYIPPLQAQTACKLKDGSESSVWGEYDCKLKVGSWTYDGHFFNLTKFNDKDNIDTSDLLSNSRVVITEGSFSSDPLETKYYDCCPDEPYTSLNFRFTVQRKYMLTSEGMKKNPNMRPAFRSYGEPQLERLRSRSGSYRKNAALKLVSVLLVVIMAINKYVL